MNIRLLPGQSRDTCVGISCAALLLVSATPTAAFEWDLGEIQGRLDTTLSQGFTFRVTDVDEDIVGIANGGRAFSVNNDDGTLNYEDREISQNISRFITDLEAEAGRLSGFVRFEGFYDWEQENGTRERTPLTEPALDVVGSDLNVLDAFVTLNFDIKDSPGQVRFGQQVLSWGESTFIPGGINIINPVDVAKFRTPGSELRTALRPLNMISGSFSPTLNTTVEAFYQLNWRHLTVDPPGTYFSTNDFVGAGGDTVFLGFGEFSDLGTGFDPLTPAINADLGATGQPLQPAFQSDFLGVLRSSDHSADDDGQWGVALRLFTEQLQGAEFGLFFINYHSRLPIISARTGTSAGVSTAQASAAAVAGIIGPGVTAATVGPAAAAQIGGGIGVDRYAKTANYFIEYPEDIKLFGASFSSEVGNTGWALQGEYSLKKDAPLQIDDVELLFAALTPLATGPIGTGFYGQFLDNQITDGGVAATDTIIPGFIERDVSQLQATATKVTGPILGANTGLFIAEAGVVHVHDMPNKSELRLNAAGTNTSGNPAQAASGGAHAGKPAENPDDFPDDTSWGYRVVAALTYNNAIGAVNLTPRVQWAHDVSGISPQPAGPFREDRKAISVGLRATYLESWDADVAYTNSFGAGSHNLLNDRDFVTFTLKYSF